MRNAITVPLITIDRSLSRPVRTSVLALVIVLLDSTCAFAGSSDCSSLGASPRIEKMRYQGNDAYSLTVATEVTGLAKDEDRNVEEQFWIQTEKGWAELKSRAAAPVPAPPISPSAISAGQHPVTLTIPLNMADLFRTFEGDVSLKHTYTIRCRDRAGIESRKTGEDYYWITPRTSKWTLREGM